MFFLFQKLKSTVAKHGRNRKDTPPAQSFSLREYGCGTVDGRNPAAPGMYKTL